MKSIPRIRLGSKFSTIVKGIVTALPENPRHAFGTKPIGTIFFCETPWSSPLFQGSKDKLSFSISAFEIRDRSPPVSIKASIFWPLINTKALVAWPCIWTELFLCRTWFIELRLDFVLINSCSDSVAICFGTVLFVLTVKLVHCARLFSLVSGTFWGSELKGLRAASKRALFSLYRTKSKGTLQILDKCPILPQLKQLGLNSVLLEGRWLRNCSLLLCLIGSLLFE